MHYKVDQKFNICFFQEKVWTIAVQVNQGERALARVEKRIRKRGRQDEQQLNQVPKKMKNKGDVTRQNTLVILIVI